MLRCPIPGRAQHITLGAPSTPNRTVSQRWDAVLCPLPAFLGSRAARTLLAGLWGRLLHKGKCCAEHLPSSDATPCPCRLGVFRPFILLPYCPMLSRAGTGGSHPPLFPSAGFASPPGPSTERQIPQDTSLEQDAGGAAAAVIFVSRFLSHPEVVLSLPKCREKSVPGTLAQVPACHLHLTLCSPLSHGQGTPPPTALPASGRLCPNTHLAPAGLCLLHPLPATASKEPAGTKSFLHPPPYQELGADLLSVKPWKAEG